MLSAAVFAAGVMAAAVFVLVMGAMDVRVEGQLTGCKCCRSFVCAARNTAVQSNARLRKRSLCAAADAAAETAERDAQDALERIRGGYKSTDRQLYREYMESKRTLPQRLAAQGITGGLTESSQVHLANFYGEELAENERARLAEEAKTYSARDARLAAARAEQSRADAEAKRTHGESLAKLWQEAEKHRREDAAKAAALLAAAGDYSGYVGMGLTQEQADYLAEIWMGRNGALASLRRARNAGNAGNSGSGSGSSLADTLSESLLLKAERGADAAVEYIAAQLASGAIRSDEAEEIWKLLRASGESDI